RTTTLPALWLPIPHTLLSVSRLTATATPEIYTLSLTTLFRSAQGAADEGSEDRDPALPDRPHGPGFEDVPRIAAGAEVVRVMRDDGVDAGEDDRQRHRQRRDVEHLPVPDPALGQWPVGQPDRDDDADEDAQRLEEDRQRTELEARDARTRDRRRDGVDHGGRIERRGGGRGGVDRGNVNDRHGSSLFATTGNPRCGGFAGGSEAGCPVGGPEGRARVQVRRLARRGV